MRKPQHKTRKKLWWLLFIIPILFVIAKLTIWKADEIEKQAILERIEKAQEEAPEGIRVYRDESGVTVIEPEEAEGDSSIAYSNEVYEVPDLSDDGDGAWETTDKIVEYLADLSPLIISILAFLGRRRLVGDKA